MGRNLASALQFNRSTIDWSFRACNDIHGCSIPIKLNSNLASTPHKALKKLKYYCVVSKLRHAYTELGSHRTALTRRRVFYTALHYVDLLKKNHKPELKPLKNK